MIVKFAILFSFMIITSCAFPNKFEVYYQAANNAFVKPLDQSITPKIIETVDLEQKLKQYQSKGYRLLGSSVFDGGWETRLKAINFARSIGATLVITTAEQIENISGIDYIHVPTINSAQQSGEIDLGYGSIAVFSATTATHGTQQIATPYNIGQYIQQAFFFAKDVDLGGAKNNVQ